jgi:hypothetical protein
MIRGTQTDSPYCSKIHFSIVLPSVSRLYKWVFSLRVLQVVLPHFCHQCREACHQIVQLLVVICCLLSSTQPRENRYVTNLSPYTCQCVLCKDCSTICGCDSASYCVFPFIWITWTAYHSSQVLATARCDVNKEQNHNPSCRMVTSACRCIILYTYQ